MCGAMMMSKGIPKGCMISRMSLSDQPLSGSPESRTSPFCSRQRVQTFKCGMKWIRTLLKQMWMRFCVWTNHLLWILLLSFRPCRQTQTKNPPIIDQQIKEHLCCLCSSYLQPVRQQQLLLHPRLLFCQEKTQRSKFRKRTSVVWW